MPINWKRYPPGWKEFAHNIKILRAGGRCECTGQCGLHGPPWINRRCVEVHLSPARFARGRIILTTAHLCRCDPPCLNPDHVIAACQRCHLRIDRALHVEHRRQSRMSYNSPHTRANLPTK